MCYNDIHFRKMSNKLECQNEGAFPRVVNNEQIPKY